MKKEKIIQEQRTIEAMKNGYMGLEGKFGKILKSIGYPILKQGGGNFSQSFLEDFYDMSEPEDMPTMDEDEIVYEIGMGYDSYSRGVNISISLVQANSEIKVFYDGLLVYMESIGELDSYVPGDWEQHIDAIYKEAIDSEKSKKTIDSAILFKNANKRRNEILDRLKKKWGV